MKRLLPAALAAQMLLAALLTASCGGDDSTSVQQTGTSDNTAAATEAVTEETDILAYLPETDMGGWQMDILCHEDALPGKWTFTAAEQNGEIIKDEIFYGTQRIEER